MSGRTFEVDPILWTPEDWKGDHDEKDEKSIPRRVQQGVPGADRGDGSAGADAAGTGAGGRNIGPGDRELGQAGGPRRRAARGWFDHAGAERAPAAAAGEPASEGRTGN